MHVTNEVALSSPPDTIYTLINDVERVAPCLPGATLDGQGEDGESYRGRVTVKVGPISAKYSGTVRFLESDESARKLVLDARGTDQHGSGTAEAKVEVQVRPDGAGSVLALDTDLLVRGKVAQFGGGAISQVSQRLMEQFAQNLSELTAGGAPATPAEVDSEVPAADTQAREAQPQASTQQVSATADSQLDAWSVVVRPLLKRYAPVAAALATGVLVGRGLRAAGKSVLADMPATATVTVGVSSYHVPVRHVVRLLRR